MNNEQFDELLTAITRIVHGPLNGADAEPMGIEALTMAMTDDIFNRPVTGSLDRISDGLFEVAEAIRALAPPASDLPPDDWRERTHRGKWKDQLREQQDPPTASRPGYNPTEGDQ